MAAMSRLCDIDHVRPAAGSIQVIRPGQAPETLYLCEEHLAEQRRMDRGSAPGSAGWGCSTTSSPDFSRIRPLEQAVVWAAPAARAHRGRSGAARRRTDRRHRAVQRRDAGAPSAGRADGRDVGEPRPRHGSPPDRGARRRGGHEPARTGRGGSEVDRRGDRGRGREGSAARRGALARAGRQARDPRGVRGGDGAGGLLHRARARPPRLGPGRGHGGRRDPPAVRPVPHQAPGAVVRGVDRPGRRGTPSTTKRSTSTAATSPRSPARASSTR